MNLDDLDLFKKIDTRNMLAQIDGLPNQLQTAWELGQTLPLPAFKDIQTIVISAMGDSAVAAELVIASVSSSIRLPVALHRGYGLPAFASGPQTLVVCISHSGNSEEVLDVFEAAQKNNCTVMVISTGGEIAMRAADKNIPAWKFDSNGVVDTAAVAYPFGLLLALFARPGLIPDPASDVAEAVAMMKRSQQHITADVIAAKNPAKRYAGQLVGRWVTFVGTENLAPVARRWKMQINQLAKAGANFEIIPESTHNTLIATINPNPTLNAHTMTLFMKAPSDHPRNKLRSDLMRQAFMLEALNTDVIEARGDSVIAHLWTLMIFGDYMAYYLAMAYGADPSEEDAFVNFKRSLS
ncbi:MAG TPA: SIS domain-containing protein [Anaerolineales bacterium]|nr:SIS domain-containing protein [Anaerolineales bacterium]HNO84885.1 SIS domain-containing protein [Anaerolineales bacterium]